MSSISGRLRKLNEEKSGALPVAKEVKFETDEEKPQGHIIPSLSENVLISNILNVITEKMGDLIPPVVERQETKIFETNDEPEAIEAEKKFLFISDAPLIGEIKKHVEYSNIRTYDTTFVNRTCKDLESNGVQYIWIDICNTNARRWLELNVRKCDPYVSCLVWRGNKRNKFLDDLKPYVNIESKLENLGRLKSLSMRELMENLENHTEIHAPANRCLSFMGLNPCGRLKKKTIR
jgi:hypothetical protein